VSTLPPEQTIVRRPHRASSSSPIQAQLVWRRNNAGALAASAKWCFVCCEVIDCPVHRFTLGGGKKSVSIRRRCRAEVPSWRSRRLRC
jgi:hypothetical protein